ncbi:oxygenase MpaB family protein [Pseudonocardia spinosispora]|uniref:oxygenase MpaB family protein n=1 Tax=Pseudonocardia spinosispora TaxID=103441 RepID=UPI001B7FAF56|nr:oxygenase MpaB family protein [Pseudonocardia spinosispora]
MARDYGLFGPDSVTWRVHTDPTMVLAGFLALEIQALHPPSMWGTQQNSRLFDRDQAFARLMRTGDFVSIRTFGSTDEVEKVGRRVRKLHARLRGTNPETGEVFRVDEPENLLWVHCGEIAAYLRVARLAGILTADEADTYVDEQRRAATVVGLEPGDVPGSAAELDAYFQDMRPKLRLTDAARDAMRSWAVVPVPWHQATLRVVFPTVAALGFVLMPGWARAMYGLPAWEGPMLDGPASAALRAVRPAMRATPDLWNITPIQRGYARHALALMRSGRAPLAMAA